MLNHPVYTSPTVSNQDGMKSTILMKPLKIKYFLIQQITKPDAVKAVSSFPDSVSSYCEAYKHKNSPGRPPGLDRPDNTPHHVHMH